MQLLFDTVKSFDWVSGGDEIFRHRKPHISKPDESNFSGRCPSKSSVKHIIERQHVDDMQFNSKNNITVAAYLQMKTCDLAKTRVLGLPWP